MTNTRVHTILFHLHKVQEERNQCKVKKISEHRLPGIREWKMGRDIMELSTEREYIMKKNMS